MNDRRVYIAQLKCPQNHCVMAATGEFDNPGDAAVLACKLGNAFGDAVKLGLVNHKCELCGATDLNVQVNPTIFRTMEEAREPLAQAEREQAAMQAFFKGSRN